MSNKKIGTVLVVGGGVAGIQSALDLADSGFKVYLVERNSSIGGVMSQLDKTFPTNDCAMCILAPKLVETGRHSDIELLVSSDVKEIRGHAGDFEVTVVKNPAYVDYSKCVGCGICAEKCPKKVSNEFDFGLSKRKAIYIRYPQSVPLKYSIDSENCIYFKTGKCRNCEKHCPTKAIDFEQKEKIVNLRVGAIILSPGFEIYKPTEYSEYENVITSIEFERILNASGPFGGKILRISDGKEPSKIAFVQCVGSRNKEVEYCSSVCCMYAIKEAIIAKEHNPDLEIVIFYMDIRAFGKEFDYYYESARNKGIKFVRSRIAEITQLENKNVVVRYVQNNDIVDEEVELVVLSVGLKPPTVNVPVNLNTYGFCETSMFDPLATSTPGIYVSGAFSEPKDIPESVAQGSGVAAKASSLLSTERTISVKEYPPEIDVSGQEPRIGVFVCHCGVNIGSVVDVSAVVEYAKTLPNVVYAGEDLYSCSQDVQQKIKQKIEEYNLNRVVVAACTPRTHEQLFQETLREAGLNPYLFEMANIRDQCSWVHMDEKDKATEKSKDLVRIAVAKSRLLEPLKKVKISVKKSALVIGGGLSGLVSALELSNQGFEVHLVEKTEKLGGNLVRVHRTLTDDNPQRLLPILIRDVYTTPKIHVHTGATITAVEGFVGNFKTILSTNKVIEHGVFIIATGGIEYKPSEYFYGRNPNVLTQLELEENLATNKFDARTVVMIQCVGSRNEERGYCSRICCSHAIKNALKIKELYPDTNVYILYKDIRTYGFKEGYYKKASEQGVIFVRYDDSNKPFVDENLNVTISDCITNDKILIKADMIVLSTGILPNPDNEKLSKLLKVPLSKDNFFLEAHMKLRPVEFATDGIFLCGLAHSPKSIDESISQAYATVSKACTILSKSEIESDALVAVVDDSKCRRCNICTELCEYEAIQLIEVNGTSKLMINTVLCKGCGSCAVDCPTGAIKVYGFTLDQIENMVREL
jgi:heterodisulfide reductase subunit A